MNSILLAQDMHSLHFMPTTKSLMLIKIDMKKAFDRIQ